VLGLDSNLENLQYSSIKFKILRLEPLYTIYTKISMFINVFVPCYQIYDGDLICMFLILKKNLFTRKVE